MITIDFIEQLLDDDISTEQEPQVQAMIDTVTSFIERDIGRHITVHEDEEFITRADGYGIIEIPDLLAVTSVTSLDPGLDVALLTNGTDYIFDGLDSIYNLEPYGVYRIVVDHGWITVPDDLKNIARLLVLAGTGLDIAATNGLRSHRTGDVEEMYGVTRDGEVTVNSLMSRVLNSYRFSPTTYRL